ncbi:hypothetical protein HOD29_00730 [archaeon]|jgi:hypothetical protein|nr:hypothetical protein [archaeon]
MIGLEVKALNSQEKEKLKTFMHHPQINTFEKKYSKFSGFYTLDNFSLNQDKIILHKVRKLPKKVPIIKSKIFLPKNMGEYLRLNLIQNEISINLNYGNQPFHYQIIKKLARGYILKKHTTKKE